MLIATSPATHVPEKCALPARLPPELLKLAPTQLDTILSDSSLTVGNAAWNMLVRLIAPVSGRRRTLA
jgi:hypothetical protein